ncbi:MAG TPA: CAP domain-containing protein [Chitinophagaceae bacterium]|nr:CAP domain-containing protein [Chitinophagaceae bacterium]
MKNPALKYYLFITLALVSVFSCAKKTAAPASSTRSAAYREKTISTATMSSDIINGVNAYRKTKGLPPLKLLALAASEAARHSSDMASKRVPFGHDGFNQRAIAIANELQGSSATGENVAFGKMTWKQVIDAWLKSPEHKANIEGAFTYTGVGVAKDSRGVVYYTQLFVKK